MIVPEPSAAERGSQGSLAAAEAIVFGHRAARATGPAPGVELSARERQILAMASRGLSNADVAAALELSIETVKSHMRRVLGKLGARNRCHAVALGYELGLLVPGKMLAAGAPPAAPPADD